jgi:hypothetical protein
MVKCCVFFAVRAEFLNIIQMNLGFKGLRSIQYDFKNIHLDITWIMLLINQCVFTFEIIFADLVH